MSARVALVVPPFQSVVRPSLGVSCLKAGLAEDGFGADVHYLNIEFADRIGVELNEWVSFGASPLWLLGDWVFAPLVAREWDPAGDEAYLAEVLTDTPPMLEAMLFRARRAASSLIADAALRIVEDEPLLVGITTSFQQNCASLALARRVKRLAPDLPICLGGGNCEGAMGRALLENFPQVDHVFSGEADRVFPEFVDRLARGAADGTEEPPPALITAERVRDLDALPIPDFDDYFAALDRSACGDAVLPGLLVETARGCWWGDRHHCTFCGVNGHDMAYRSKSPERVVEELDELSRRHGQRRFEATDNILHPRVTLDALDRVAGENIDLRLFYEVKPSMTHDQLLRAARGGMTWVQAGIETLDDEILDLADKGGTALGNVRFLRDCLEIGIRAVWIVLHGFPGESDEVYGRMADRLPLLEHLSPPESCFPVFINRFSPYHTRPAEYGIRDVRPQRAYELIYDVSDDVLDDLAYYFQGDGPAAPDEAVEPLREGIAAWRERFFAEGERPVLSLRRRGGQPCITDTRSLARARHRFLTEQEVRVLAAFRKPARILPALAEMERSGGEEHYSAVFDLLCGLGFLMQDGPRAVSLVCEEGARIHGWDAFVDFPGGSCTAHADRERVAS